MILDARLEAEVRMPSGPRVPLLVLAHPHPLMGGNMHNKVVDQIFQRAAERGWGAVRFNFRGVGASPGAFDHGAGETDDVLAAVGWAARNFGCGPGEITLAGYSFGSWVGARAAAALPELNRLILVAPPVATMDFPPLSSCRHRKNVFAAGRDEITPRGVLDAWYAELSPPKTIQVFEEADHFFVGHTTELVRAVLRALDSN